MGENALVGASKMPWQQHLIIDNLPIIRYSDRLNDSVNIDDASYFALDMLS